MTFVLILITSLFMAIENKLINSLAFVPLLIYVAIALFTDNKDMMNKLFVKKEDEKYRKKAFKYLIFILLLNFVWIFIIRVS